MIEKLQYDIDRSAAKMYLLSSGKTNIYEFLTGEGILPQLQHNIIQVAKITYSALEKTFEKQRKNIGEQGNKHVKALKTLDLKYRHI